jgi:hypothetical protein
MTLKVLSILSCLTLSFCNSSLQNSNKKNTGLATCSRIEMNLSAFGVESDGAPYIRAIIDFVNDSSFCERWYDNPVYKDSSWLLTKEERATVLQLLASADIKSMQKKYKTLMTDQPTSAMTIYTGKDTILINDYGLTGQYPLSEIYKIVYKLNINFR